MVCGTLGQLCVFMMIASFGALSTSLVTTSRKFVSVLLSVIWFGHSLTYIQDLSIMLVFGCLVLDSMSHQKHTKQQLQQQQQQQLDHVQISNSEQFKEYDHKNEELPGIQDGGSPQNDKNQHLQHEAGIIHFTTTPTEEEEKSRLAVRRPTIISI